MRYGSMFGPSYTAETGGGARPASGVDADHQFGRVMRGDAVRASQLVTVTP